MTFEEAKEFLNGCVRQELRDHYFGDREVYWKHQVPGEDVAEAYFGGGQVPVVYILSPDVETDQTVFTGDEARELVKCGRIVQIVRNDETGPDEYGGA